jgi:UDP-N-acetylglucosamine--N-acetylmuramyl-(pentapeptide) pyrophosphoryl-undecaprenol N-acetylglucosamine transferase
MSPIPSSKSENAEKRGVRVLIAAGGSGGHIFPAIALARTLKNKGWREIKFMGSGKAIDRRIFEKEGLDFSLLSSNKLPYKLSPYIIVFFAMLSLDALKSLFYVASYRPSVVIGFGGYVSFPVMLAAKVFNLPIILHEQNVMPGRANRLLFAVANRIAVSFSDTIENIPERYRKKSIVTGNPIRTEDFKKDRESAARNFGFDISKFTVLVVGGSQGARAINKNFIASLPMINHKVISELQIIHITGQKDYETSVIEYGKMPALDARVYSFIDRIEDAYNAADIIITRAGASALFEAAFFGKAMIVVPYPYAKSHQIQNAGAFLKKAAAIVVEEKDLAPAFFKDNIERFYNDRPGLSALSERSGSMARPLASAKLAEAAESIAKG